MLKKSLLRVNRIYYIMNKQLQQRLRQLQARMKNRPSLEDRICSLASSTAFLRSWADHDTGRDLSHEFNLMDKRVISTKEGGRRIC